MTDFVDGISDGQFSIIQIKASTARFRTYASTQWFPVGESNPGLPRDRRGYLPLYHVAIKAGLYCKAVQVYHIPMTTTYSPSVLRFVHESLFEQPLNIRPPSLLGHQARQMGLFTLGARCNR